MAITKKELLKLKNGSDVRGVACEGIEGEHVNLTEEAAYLIGRAFVIWLMQKKNLTADQCVVGIGTDSRITGPALKKQAIKGMLAEGKTQREVAEHYGFKDKQVVKRLLERERRKERKMEVGILPRPKGRPRKGAAPSDIVLEQAYEIQRLQMENKLLRDFVQYTGRK